MVMFLIYIDLFNFGNPVIEKEMKKTFWSYPKYVNRMSENLKKYIVNIKN